MTRIAVQKLSSTTRCIVLALAFAVPLTTGFPPRCAGHSIDDSNAQDCYSQHISDSIGPARFSGNHACCHQCVMCASGSQSIGLSSTCHYSTACHCPPDCDCRQTRPASPASHSASPLRLQLLLLSTAELSLVDGSVLHPSQPFVHNQADLAPTTSLRCALLCRFLV